MDQNSVFTDDYEKAKEEYELCDHEYSVRSKGEFMCLSCGFSERRLLLFRRKVTKVGRLHTNVRQMSYVV